MKLFSKKTVLLSIAVLALVSLAPACADTPTEDVDAGVTDDTQGGGDGVVGTPDGETGVDGATVDSAADPDAVTDPDGDDPDTTTDPDGEDPDTITDPDADTPDGVDPDDTVVEDVVDGKKLPLPDCAKPCGKDQVCSMAQVCGKCPTQTICGPGPDGKWKPYDNDCEAIWELEAYDGLNPDDFFPNACPECSECSPTEKPDPKGFCATLKSGTKVSVDMMCKTKCLDLAEDGGINPTYGACKSKCSLPKVNGGAGCPISKYQPVCSKTDNKTYQTECAMQACDLQGCFPVGDGTQSGQCAPGSMTKDCDGECYDATKWPNCNGDCNPVCGITGKGAGQTFRNTCVAQATGAKVGNCDGISATPKDKCSAELYKEEGLACCPDVDYTIVKQVCASNGSGITASWVTFRSNAEYTCLTTGDSSWVKQYNGPCICNCALEGNAVCGADGLQYANSCQAKCYNGDSFTWKDGPCGG